jgi:hypothetical protein
MSTSGVRHMKVRVVVATAVLAVAGLATIGDAVAKKKTKKFATEVKVTSTTPPNFETGAPGQIAGKVDSKNSKCLGERPVTVDEADASGNPAPFPDNFPGTETDGSGNFTVTTGGSSDFFPNVIIEVDGAKKGKVVCKAATLVTPRP